MERPLVTEEAGRDHWFAIFRIELNDSSAHPRSRAAEVAAIAERLLRQLVEDPDVWAGRFDLLSPTLATPYLPTIAHRSPRT